MSLAYRDILSNQSYFQQETCKKSKKEALIPPEYDL